MDLRIGMLGSFALRRQRPGHAFHGDTESVSVRLQGVTSAEHGQRAIGVPGIGLVVTGGLLVLVAFRFLDWYDVPTASANSAGEVTFGKLHSSAEQLSGAGMAGAYFGWLAWTLLIALLVAGVGANVASPAADALRVTGFTLGIAGAGTTYLALAQHFDATASEHGVFYNSTWGVWATLAGFLAAGAGAAIGPRRAR